MKKRDSLEVLINSINPHKRSKRYQKIFPSIVKQYFEGKSLNEVKKLNRKDKKFAIQVYYQLEQIKMNGLKKISGIIGKHPEDLKDDSEFGETIIEYSIGYGLKKEIFQVFNKQKSKLRSSLYEKYRNGNKGLNVREALKIIKPDLYLFVLENILLNN